MSYSGKSQTRQRSLAFGPLAPPEGCPDLQGRPGAEAQKEQGRLRVSKLRTQPAEGHETAGGDMGEVGRAGVHVGPDFLKPLEVVVHKGT